MTQKNGREQHFFSLLWKFMGLIGNEWKWGVKTNHALFYKIQNNTKDRDLFLGGLEDFSVGAGFSQREKVDGFSCWGFFEYYY